MGWSALVDRSANGSIAGQEMRIIAKLDKTIDLSGIDDHTVSNLRLDAGQHRRVESRLPVLPAQEVAVQSGRL